MNEDLKKYMDELVKDTQKAYEERVQEQSMMNYYRSLLPEETTKIHRKKIRRISRVLKR